jgi:hypothetical protein
MHPIVKELRAYRVAADLSYERLAHEIERTTGRAFSASTLFHICTDPDPRPQDRTLRKLETFLEGTRTNGSRRARRQGRR